jgi:hypothetical protein
MYFERFLSKIAISVLENIKSTPLSTLTKKFNEIIFNKPVRAGTVYREREQSYF